MAGQGGRLVRDCHAEVLARRGLLKYLYSELNALIRQEEKDPSDQQPHQGYGASYENSESGEIILPPSSSSSPFLSSSSSPPSPPSYHSSPPRPFNNHTSPPQSATPHSSAFTRCPSTGLLMLKAGCSLHLYTSSQPCGNATIKKWGKGRKPQKYPFLSEGEYPMGTHPRLQVCY